MIRVHHDFETFSELDIKQVGAHKYAMHPSTEVLMLSWAVGGDSPQIWVPAEGEPMPGDLEALVYESLDSDSPEVEWYAFNAQFERLIWWHVLKYKIPTRLFHCTMMHAWSLSFAGNLAQVGDELGVREDQRKLKRGAQLIQKFCKPAPSNHRAARYTHENAPDDWAEFKTYCKQDVVAERSIQKLIEGYPVPARERELWLWDQDVNDRGVPIDLDLVRRAVKIDQEAKRKVRAEMNSLTYLDNANSNPQLQGWLELHGTVVPNMQAETLKTAIAETEDPLVKHVLELKLQSAKTSATKWSAFERATGDDGLLRGMFQFGGAQRTQRWAGRVVQLHNLKSPTSDDPVTSSEILFEDLPTIEALYGSPLDLLSEVVRCAITAPEGYSLVPVDLSSIESRGLGYLANCARINAVFAAGKDTYKDFATEYFHVAYEQVTKAQRRFCKPPVLGCGYRLGPGTREKMNGLIAYADGMGVFISNEDSKRAVSTWREIHPEVVSMWEWLDDAISDVVEHWTVREGYGVRIRRDDNFMFIDLPSGRSLHYYVPMILLRIPPWEQDRIDAGEIEAKDARRKPTFTYMGMNQYINKWDRLTSHGGKVTENIVQAFCRDILAFHMLEIEADLGPVIRGHVHDEAIPLLPENIAHGCLHHMEEVMRRPPPWAPGILLDAAGFVTKRYTKE